MAYRPPVITPETSPRGLIEARLQRQALVKALADRISALLAGIPQGLPVAPPAYPQHPVDIGRNPLAGRSNPVDIGRNPLVGPTAPSWLPERSPLAPGPVNPVFVPRPPISQHPVEVPVQGEFPAPQAPGLPPWLAALLGRFGA